MNKMTGPWDKCHHKQEWKAQRDPLKEVQVEWQSKKFPALEYVRKQVKTHKNQVLALSFCRFLETSQGASSEDSRRQKPGWNISGVELDKANVWWLGWEIKLKSKGQWLQRSVNLVFYLLSATEVEYEVSRAERRCLAIRKKLPSPYLAPDLMLVISTETTLARFSLTSLLPIPG